MNAAFAGAFVVAVLGAWPCALAGQSTELTLEDFLARVAAAHPVVRQVDAARAQVAAEALAARGGFDPVLTATWDTKDFKGIGYYDELDVRLTVPTRLGFDLKFGWERAAGAIINPERATPSAGLLSAGIALPIGPRLLTDERRTALRQAELAQDAADADRDAAMARVLQEAARDWGTWAELTERSAIARDGVVLARFRLEALRRRVAEGDAAPIDTVEAAAELGAREIARFDAEQGAEGARRLVEGWLWSADGAPTELGPGARPSGGATLSALDALGRVPERDALGYVVARHPAVRRMTARWRTVEAQRRLAAVNLLPSASVELSGLAAGSSLGAMTAPNLSGDDSKFSGTVRLPLFPRGELGRLRVAEARARAVGAERERVRRDVGIEVARAMLELEAVDSIAGRQEAVVALLRQLVEAEQQRFAAGESSLLLVNLRERALLDERLRLATLVARRARALGTLAVAVGTPQLSAGGTSGR